MKILVIGGGGREHALCWRLAQSESCKKVYCAPGNAGIAQVAECVQLQSHADMVAFCLAHVIDLVVVGPEQPLVDGLADSLRADSIAVFGCSQAAAQIEGSKGFSKDLMHKYNIPTADYMCFDNAQEAISYVQAQGAPIVIKADGLAAGKGVTVAMTLQEAVDAVEDCFSGKFGAAGASVVIEEFMEGEEASFFALCDGNTAIEFASAQDHKRVGEGDSGPNTGGMGTYSPAPCMSDAIRNQVMDDIVLPTIMGMKKEGCPYSGILFVGLMLTDNGPKVVEYNCRFGDPETQVMLPRIKGDFADILLKSATGKLDQVDVELSDDATLCVVMAANGYPGAYEKGSVIASVDKAEALDGVTVFHAGTRARSPLGGEQVSASNSEAQTVGGKDHSKNTMTTPPDALRRCAPDASAPPQGGGCFIANGGRVLGVTALAPSIKEAQTRAYEAVDAIDWPEGFCRRDIGWRAV